VLPDGQVVWLGGKSLDRRLELARLFVAARALWGRDGAALRILRLPETNQDHAGLFPTVERREGCVGHHRRGLVPPRWR
jgi:hypothetical protein